MKVLRRLLFLFLAVATTLQAAGQDGFRTFKDPQGREMEARISRVSGDDVYIERRDGLSTRVKIDIFSQADQEFIREWARKAKIEKGVLELRFTVEESNERDSEMGGIIRDQYDAHYEIIMENVSSLDFEDLRIEYLVIKFQDAIAAQKRSEGEIKRLKGSVDLDALPARSEATVATESVSMLETKLAPNYYWADGGKRKSKDTLEGIWVKIYAGDSLIHEESRPENMIRTEVW